MLQQQSDDSERNLAMATVAHPGTTYFGETSTSLDDARALLERAIAAAANNAPAPRGWLRRLLARDNSAAALVRRYRLWPAIEHAYARVVGEFGRVRVEASVEGDGEPEFVSLVLRCESEEFDRMNELSLEIGDECSELIGERDWYRLHVWIDPTRGSMRG